MVKGIHHVSMKCQNEQEYNEEVSFYTQILGLTVDRVWGGGIMLDTGNGIVEIFKNGTDHPGQGSIRHFALDVDDGPDDPVEKVRSAGYAVTVEPRDIDLVGLKARIAFVVGPLGEEIELFRVY